MRITVVGGGVIGLLTAIECVRAGGGHEVDLVDAGPIPSPSATSNDRLRVVRALHRGAPTLTLAAAGAHAGWMDVECLVGTRFYHPTGALTAMPPQDASAELALLTTAGAKAWALSPADLASWYPGIRFPAGSGAVLEATAGVVLADHALVAMARWLGAQSRVRLHPHRQVVSVSQSGDAGVVRFADGDTRTADRIVVARRTLVPGAVASRYRRRPGAVPAECVVLPPADHATGLGRGTRDPWSRPRPRCLADAVRAAVRRTDAAECGERLPTGGRDD